MPTTDPAHSWQSDLLLRLLSAGTHPVSKQLHTRPIEGHHSHPQMETLLLQRPAHKQHGTLGSAANDMGKSAAGNQDHYLCSISSIMMCAGLLHIISARSLSSAANNMCKDAKQKQKRHHAITRLCKENLKVPSNFPQTSLRRMPSS